MQRPAIEVRQLGEFVVAAQQVFGQSTDADRTGAEAIEAQANVEVRKTKF